MKKKSKTFVITGATGDIAQEIVKLLPDDQLILVSRSKAALQGLYGELKNVILLTNDELLAADSSVSDDFSADKAISCDILINNAGFGIFKNLSEQTDAEIAEQFAINTLLPIQLVRQLQPKVQLVNIASIAGKIPTAKSTIYAASKAALIAFSDALRMENPKLIVTTVNTGPVKTKFHKDNATYLKKVGKNTITAEFVAKKIVKNLGKNKREINLPWQISLASKFRALFPQFADKISAKFFNYK
jgi:short-subunit dehydrogenase